MGVCATRTEELVTTVMFANEVAEDLLIHAGSVGDCSIPESTPKLQSLQKDRFGLFIAEVVAQCEADAHSTETRHWNFQAFDER